MLCVVCCVLCVVCCVLCGVRNVRHADDGSNAKVFPPAAEKARNHPNLHLLGFMASPKFPTALLFISLKIFFWPQFRYDFSSGSESTPLGPLFLFSSFLFLHFLSFFLLFIFDIFIHFLFISSFFFDFFSVFQFFHFSKEKSFFLSFFLYFGRKYFLLLASVSEFNCFLRSRCSMDMWCPDDIGRDSWDWVGPPAWGRACFNSPEWGGG